MSSTHGFYKTVGKILGPTYNYASSSRRNLQEHENDDAPFLDKVKRSKYECISGSKKKYRVYLNKDKYHHWFIILHLEEEGTTYPFLTIEINTVKDCVKLIPVMKELPQEAINTKWEVFKIEIKLDTLCKIADDIVAEMGKYNLFTNDCQTFCNDLLLDLKLIKKPFATPFGPDKSKRSTLVNTQKI